MDKGSYVQYGCGFAAPQGWRNFDASPTVRFERLPIVGRLYTKNATRFPENVEYGDIVKGLPIPPESCGAVYCSHVLEHLPLESFRLALKNTYRMLRPGGLFRLVVPDLEFCVKQYVDDESSEAALSFMRSTGLGREQRPGGLKGLVVSWLGNSEHLWMWDFRSLAHELQNSGFTDVRKAFFGDSSEPMFRGVEDQERWRDCLGIECRRPIERPTAG